jgi:hypothetical protein
MLRRCVTAAGLLLLAGGPAFAADYPPEPPRAYMVAPPGEWHRHDVSWAAYRHESWRCDHGDRGACDWLHHHG